MSLKACTEIRFGSFLPDVPKFIIEAVTLFGLADA